jgi:hypothetical protein
VRSLSRKLGLIAARTGKPVPVPAKHKYKYGILITNDEITPGYISSFIVVKSQPLWGFHIVWVRVQGEFRSATAGHRIVSTKYDIVDYGTQFLKTFNLTIERRSKIEHFLGHMGLLGGHPKWSEKELLNILLMDVYGQMWDLDVEIAKFEEVPEDVVADFHAFVDEQFGDV